MGDLAVFCSGYLPGLGKIIGFSLALFVVVVPAAGIATELRARFLFSAPPCAPTQKRQVTRRTSLKGRACSN